MVKKLNQFDSEGIAAGSLEKLAAKALHEFRELQEQGLLVPNSLSHQFTPRSLSAFRDLAFMYEMAAVVCGGDIDDTALPSGALVSDVVRDTVLQCAFMLDCASDANISYETLVRGPLAVTVGLRVESFSIISILNDRALPDGQPLGALAGGNWNPTFNSMWRWEAPDRIQANSASIASREVDGYLNELQNANDRSYSAQIRVWRNEQNEATRPFTVHEIEGWLKTGSSIMDVGEFIIREKLTSALELHNTVEGRDIGDANGMQNLINLVEAVNHVREGEGQGPLMANEIFHIIEDFYNQNRVPNGGLDSKAHTFDNWLNIMKEQLADSHPMWQAGTEFRLEYLQGAPQEEMTQSFTVDPAVADLRAAFERRPVNPAQLTSALENYFHGHKGEWEKIANNPANFLENHFLLPKGVEADSRIAVKSLNDRNAPTTPIDFVVGTLRNCVEADRATRRETDDVFLEAAGQQVSEYLRHGDVGSAIGCLKLVQADDHFAEHRGDNAAQIAQALHLNPAERFNFMSEGHNKSATVEALINHALGAPSQG
ncbi:hypothetical protein GC177_07845 [bacterium]|nr:hypothetical protein [bacterium]